MQNKETRSAKAITGSKPILIFNEASG